ncbi:MAG TPA: cupredoxin domain-containing protein [Candidatus Limnocylindrales bacterium]
MPATKGATLAVLALAAGTALAGCIPGTTVTTILATVGGSEVTASNFQFEPTTVEVSAGEPLELEFVNDDGAPHNLSIYRDASAADKLFGGEVVSGPGSREYSLPALPVGAWYFRCDIHPAMHGTIIATGAEAPGTSP